MHLFKLQAAVNAASLVNLVRAHSEWRATRPFLEAGALPPPSRASSSSLHGTPRRSASEGRAQWRDGDSDSAWNSQPASAAAPSPKAPVRWGSSDSAASAQQGWVSFGDGNASTATPPPLPPKVNTWSVEPPPSAASIASYFDAPPSSAGSTPRTSAVRSELLYRQYSGGVGTASCSGDNAQPQSYFAPPPPQPLRAPPPPPPPLAEPAPLIQL